MTKPAREHRLPTARFCKIGYRDLQSEAIPISDKIELAMSKELVALMEKYPDKKSADFYSKELEVVVDPVKALFGSWYEMFPRSCSARSRTSRHI